MTAKEIYQLIQPCQNRSLPYLIDYKTGEIVINGKRFSTLKDAEGYLEKIPRKEIK